MKKNASKIIIVLVIACLFYLTNKYGLLDYLSLDFIKSNLGSFKDYYSANPVQTIGAFFGIYVLATALSLPGATILTLSSGALFGFGVGLLIASFASSIGATFAFLASRFLLRDSLESKFSSQLKSFNDGIEKDGAFYLLTLRLVPLVPFFVINLVMGLTKMKTAVYYLVSQIGMIAGTAVYVNAGLQLSELDSLKGILSPKIILSFVLLGIFPIIAKSVVSMIKSRKVYKGFKKPKSFDYNLVVIGAGSAGLVTSYIAAAVKAKVALIEKNKMGGDCLNTGCVPSKAIIKSAKVAHKMKTAEVYGLEAVTPQFDFKKVMGRVHDVIAKIEPHDSVERYGSLGVDCIQGEATIVSPWEVKVGDKVYTTKNITIATGASPFLPPMEGLDLITPLTSENLWELKELPKKFIVLGGGPIGCEMAQSFNRLGSEVTQIEMGDRIMKIEDPEVSEVVQGKMIKEGVNLLTNHRAIKIVVKDDKKFLLTEHDGKQKEIEFDEILFAIGRRANIKGFGLENLDVKLRKNGTIEANEYLQTNYPNIYACGDVTGPFQLTHTAAHQAWYTSVNPLFGIFKKFKVDYSVIPWATYTDPEVATVGLNEQTAKREGIEYELTVYGLDDLDRAIAESEDHGMVRVLTKPGTDKILGATIVGMTASDMIIEFISAMKNGVGLNGILGTIHPYPSMIEANKFAAGEWKRKQTPQWAFDLLTKFHNWRRS